MAARPVLTETVEQAGKNYVELKPESGYGQVACRQYPVCLWAALPLVAREWV